MTVDLICPYCQFSKKIPREKIPKGVKWANCPRCRQRFEIFPPEEDIPFITHDHDRQDDDESTDREEMHRPKRKGAPWEQRPDLGLWKSIYITFKEVLFSPESLFKSLTYKDGIREPLAFGLLLGSIGSMFGFFWQFIMMSGAILTFAGSIFSQFTALLIFGILVVFVPIYVIISLFVYSSILHVLLLIVGGAKNGYEATFRVVAYSQAANLWGIVPLVGWIGGIWKLVVQIVGLREIHETSYLRVIMAFLIPLILGVIIFVVVLIPIIIYVIGYPINELWS